ncbi:hypothetical protein CBL_00270 [Carabus blaptoides fortunei]
MADKETSLTRLMDENRMKDLCDVHTPSRVLTFQNPERKQLVRCGVKCGKHLVPLRALSLSDDVSISTQRLRLTPSHIPAGPLPSMKIRTDSAIVRLLKLELLIHIPSSTSVHVSATVCTTLGLYRILTQLHTEKMRKQRLTKASVGFSDWPEAYVWGDIISIRLAYIEVVTYSADGRHISPPLPSSVDEWAVSVRGSTEIIFCTERSHSSAASASRPANTQTTSEGTAITTPRDA